MIDWIAVTGQIATFLFSLALLMYSLLLLSRLRRKNRSLERQLREQQIMEHWNDKRST